MDASERNKYVFSSPEQANGFDITSADFRPNGTNLQSIVNMFLSGKFLDERVVGFRAKVLAPTEFQTDSEWSETVFDAGTK